MATVGNTTMSVAELVQNITASTDQIAKALPGGAQNIRNIYVKTEHSMSIPLYVSEGSANDVQLTEVKKQKAEIITDEITTVKNGRVQVYPGGFVKLVDEEGKAIKSIKKVPKRVKAVKRAGRKGVKQFRDAKRKKTAKKDVDSTGVSRGAKQKKTADKKLSTGRAAAGKPLKKQKLATTRKAQPKSDNAAANQPDVKRRKNATKRKASSEGKDTVVKQAGKKSKVK